MIEILSASELERARVTGHLVGNFLHTLKQRTHPGVNLLQIDQWTHEMIDAAGAESCYVDYAPSFGEGPFAHYICTSVNDAVLHGMPHDYVLADGDLLTLDLAIIKDGIASDAAISFVVGEYKTEEDLKLVETTQKALAAAIAVAAPGKRIGDISYEIGEVLFDAGYPINMEFGGHGIGTTMHQDPHIANDGRQGRGYKLRKGMLIAIEPWVMADTDELVVDPHDGWTLRSATGCRTAHTEHTIEITETGSRILTLPTAQ